MSKQTVRSSEYWEERALDVAAEGEKTALEVLTDLEKTYESARKVIEKEINAFYGKYAKETGLTLQDVQQRLNRSELKSAMQDIQFYYDEVKRLGGYSSEYRTYLRSLSARAHMSRLEELNLQMRNEVEKLYRKQNIEFTSNLSNTYSDSYYKTIFNLQRGFGFSNRFATLNTTLVNKAISMKWLGANYSDRIWANKARLLNSLETTFLRGVALGQNPNKIAKEMIKDTGTSFNNAVRLARTEFNHIANQATLDGYKEHGIVKYYNYLATLDEKTCDDCGPLDGKHFPVEEAMEGVNYAPMHPRCRCTSTGYFPPDEIDAMFDKAERAARDPKTGKTYYVPADLTFTEWKAGLSESDGTAIYTK